jgi:hypothetical protein
MVVNPTELVLFWVDYYWIIVIPGRLLLQDTDFVIPHSSLWKESIAFFRSRLFEGKVGNMTDIIYWPQAF